MTNTAEQKRRFRITFNGRERGAIGITYRITKDVEAPNDEAARLKLYDTHEHILVSSVTDITDEG